MWKRRSNWFWLAILIAIVAFWFFWTGKQQGGYADVGGSHHAVAYDQLSDPALDADEVIVDFNDDISPARVLELDQRFGVVFKPVGPEVEADEIYRADVDPARRDALVEELRKLDDVEAAEPDMMYGIPQGEVATPGPDTQPVEKGFPNDPKYKYQWHLQQIHMPETWKPRRARASSSRSSTPASPRSPTWPRPSSSRLQLRQQHRQTRHGRSRARHARRRHDRAVDPQRRRRGGRRLQGARSCRSRCCRRAARARWAAIAEGIRYAADHGAKVINMSLGGPHGLDRCSPRRSSTRTTRASSWCAPRATTAAARSSYPAAYPGAIAVAATQFDETTTFYSNWGKEIDVAAPGGNTRVDQNGDGMPDGVLQNTDRPRRHPTNDYLMFHGHLDGARRTWPAWPR